MWIYIEAIFTEDSMNFEIKRETNLSYIDVGDSFCNLLASEFARSPTHRNRVHSVIRLLTHESLNTNSSILEVGCGAGHVATAVARSGFRVRAADIREDSIRQARLRYSKEDIQFDCLDATLLDVASYDAIILTEVLEHVSTYRPFFLSLFLLVKR